MNYNKAELCKDCKKPVEKKPYEASALKRELWDLEDWLAQVSAKDNRSARYLDIARKKLSYILNKI